MNNFGLLSDLHFHPLGLSIRYIFFFTLGGQKIVSFLPPWAHSVLTRYMDL